MKLLTLITTLLFVGHLGNAQSKVMKKLAEVYPDATTFMIYHSNLTMLNQADDPELAELAATIDKIKVHTIPNFTKEAKKQLVSDLEAHDFEALMTVKHEGADVLVYINGDDDDIEGYFLLVQSEEGTMAIDVLGSPSAKQIGKIIDTVKNN